MIVPLLVIGVHLVLVVKRFTEPEGVAIGKLSLVVLVLLLHEVALLEYLPLVEEVYGRLGG
jgi:hypothetical protein